MASRDIILDIIAKVQSREVERLAAEMDAAAKSTDGASKAASRQRDTLEVLDREIRTAQARVRELGDEFRKTGSVDAFDNLRKASKELRGLERIKTDVSKALVTGVEDAGKQVAQGIPAFGGGVVRSISTAISDMPPQAQAAIYGAVVAAIIVGAPLIGAAASAAILTGIGGGALAAGIALAVKDPSVAAAFGGLGGELKDELSRDAQVFAQPLIHTAQIFGEAFHDVEPDIRSTFGSLATTVEPLARGIAGMAREAMPGIRQAAAAAVPLFRVLAQEGPAMGRAITFALRNISDGSPGAVHALKDLVVAAEVGIRAVGALATGLEFAFDLVHNKGNILATVSDVEAAHIQSLATSANDVGSAFGSASGDADALTASARRLSDELSGTINDQIAVKQAADAWQQSLLNLKTSVDENGKSLDATKEKGLANRDAILASAQAAEREREATIQAAGGQNASKEAIDAANAKYAAQIDQLRQLALHLGFSKSAVDDLIKGLDAIPVVKSTEVKIRVTGDVTTFNNLQHMSDGSYHSYKVEARAGGGSVRRGVPYLVGEDGPELFSPGQDGTIIPNGVLTSGMSTYTAAAPAVDPQALVRAFVAALQGVQVVLDGQAVGHIQGRQALLYTRGG